MMQGKEDEDEKMPGDLLDSTNLFLSKKIKSSGNKSMIEDEETITMDKDMEEYYDLFRKRWFILPKASFFKTLWNNVIIILAIYNSFSTPMIIAFITV